MDEPFLSGLSDKELLRWRQEALFLLYPSLLGFLSAAFGSFSASYGYALAPAAERSLMLFCREAPLNGNLALSLLAGSAVALLIALCAGFLAYRAAQGRLWPILVWTGAYLLDGIYGACLYSSMGWPIYLTSLLLHAAFLAVYAYLLWRYGKLKRRGETRKAPNINAK
jgi:hypothetical protein